MNGRGGSIAYKVRIINADDDRDMQFWIMNKGQ